MVRPMKKKALTYAIDASSERKIRSFVNRKNKQTRIPKGKIATDLILAGIAAEEGIK